MKTKKKRSPAARIFRGISIFLLVILLLAGGLIGFLSIAEYRPADRETVPVEGTAERTLKDGDSLTVLSWNIGYAALGETADFFMDGGTMVRAESRELVEQNLAGIEAELSALKPDVLFLQEVDRDSSRSSRVKEYAELNRALPSYQSSFANNYNVAYVPYPMPPLGKVDSGLATFSRFAVSDAQRIQLPVPFSWPVSTINLKRCLLVSRISIEGSEKELVLVNLHLEAYDDGEGKIAQTAMLAAFLQDEAEKGNYVIAGGDFNQIFSSADGSRFPTMEGNWQAGQIDVTQFSAGWKFLMDENVPSCRLLDRPYHDADPDTFQYYMIDGFIISDNLTVELFETQDLGFVVSDHNPVLLRVTLGAN